MPESMTSSSKDQSATSSDHKTAQAQANLEEHRKQADQRMRPGLEAQRAQAQQEAEQTLDSEAIAAVQQTERALFAIAENRIDEAVAAIEQATGKIEILLSRNPATALIPVNAQVSVIDTAPQSVADVRVLRDAAQVAFDISDLPRARTLLDSLRSEIRVRTYHLPLATYPTALQEAARLLDQKRIDEAGSLLLVALNTLVVIDQVIALPLLVARAAVNEAQTQAQTNKEAARNLLEIANRELERAMELGYTPNDADYTALRDEIKNLRKQLTGNEDSTQLFSRLKEKLASLTRRRGQKQTRIDAQKPDEQKQPKKAA
jgi:hypothetical protein